MRILAASLAAVVLATACGPGASIAYRPPPAGSDHRTGLGTLGARLASAMHATYRAHEDTREAPLSLVPTDGTELQLRALDAQVDITGPLARTRLHLVFHNPEARQREGRFAITLPAGATISRFAMKIAGEWRDARIVPREKGRRVYESFLHKRIDPALLEQDLGNTFSARVFPIEATSDKELLLAYDHGVSSDAPYTLALAGLPPVPKATVRLTHDGATRTIEQHGESLADVRAPIAPGASAVAGTNAFVARVAPIVEATDAAPIDSVLVLVDTSASRGPVMAKQAVLVRDLLGQLPPQAIVEIAAFDHAVTPLYRGAASHAHAAATALLDHGALGASDLGGALAYAAAASRTRVVLVGDGVPTLGEHDVRALARTLAGAGLERIDAIQVGDSLDREALLAIVGAGRARGAILEGRDVMRLAFQLQRALPSERAIYVDGVQTSWPATTRGLAPGAPIWVWGLRSTTGDVVVHVGERTERVPVHTGDAAQVRRAVAGAELVAMTDRLASARPEQRGELARQLEHHAMTHQLVSARTSLIVLETEAQEHAMLGPALPPPGLTPGSTSQGITIDRDYLKNIPIPGRTFESALGAAAGSQGDELGVSFWGSSSLESQYYVDGVNTTGLSFGTVGGPYGLPPGRFAVKVDVMSPLAQDLIAESMRRGYPQPRGERFSARAFDDDPPPQPRKQPPYTGAFEQTLSAIAAGRTDEALERATRWHLGSPGEIAAIIALGEALEARGAADLAARAYGSILDLYPNRAELARTAGERLDRIPSARPLAIDAYRRALRERPDHVTTSRLLAFSLVRAGQAEEALEVLARGRDRARDHRIQEVYVDDQSVIAAHLVARGASQQDLSRRYFLNIDPRPSIRFVLSWETDANDVDLHVTDRHGDTASYEQPTLPSGGKLLADLTDGYGPEQFEIAAPAAFPYRLRAHYYTKGAMGVGLGTVQVIRYDGNGTLTVDDRPFLIQNDHAMVDLGTVER